MGFLDNMKNKTLQQEKAAAYDGMVKQNEAKTIYEKGLADSANEISKMFAFHKVASMQPQEHALPVEPQVSIGMPQPNVGAGLAQQNLLGGR